MKTDDDALGRGEEAKVTVIKNKWSPTVFSTNVSQNSQEENKILNMISKSLCELSSSSLWPALSPFHSCDCFILIWKYQEWHCLWILLVFPALLLPGWVFFHTFKAVSSDLPWFLKCHLQVLKIDTASVAPFPAVL